MQNQVYLPDLQKKAFINAPIETVWAAIATSEGLAKWFMLNDFKPVKGHKFELNRGQFGVSPCYVKEVSTPHHLSFTWGKDWTVAFDLKDRGDLTEFTVTHSGWHLEKLTEFRAAHPVVHENMDIGWSNLIKKLYDYVEGNNRSY
jgi:uncharacterized protein YndB with AHSA1/START domain